MQNRSHLGIRGAAIATAILAISSQVQAANPCQPVFDALIKVAITPSHSYTTNTPVNGGRATQAETIFANGQKYIRVRGKWIRIPVPPRDVVEQEKERGARDKSICQLMRIDFVNGEAANVYSVHREYDEVKKDGEMWISSGTGLLLRVDEDVDNRGNKVKEHQSTRFEYGNVRPPI